MTTAAAAAPAIERPAAQVGRVQPSRPARASEPAWLGGAAAIIASTITHPADQTKIRTQTQRTGQGMFATLSATVQRDGLRGLWTGVSGSWARQATYGAARFGIYRKLNERSLAAAAARAGAGAGDTRGAEKLPRWVLVQNGAIAGVFAGVVGAPGELVMVRMCADAVKPVDARFGYKHALDGIYQIARKEGAGQLFRGLGPTVTRSVIMNASQLSCYDIIKENLLRTGYFADRTPLHLITAVCGGTIAVTLVAPVDVIKSRVQSASKSRPVLSVVTHALRTEGVSVLFRGWLPAWCRMTPQTALTFVFYEQLRRWA